MTSRDENKRGKYSAMVDDEDYDYLMQFTWAAEVAKKTVYARTYRQGEDKRWETVTMNRLLLGFVKGDGNFADHKDGNGLNNQRYNIRKATRSQNAANMVVRSDTSSKFLGVTMKNGSRKWIASIKKDDIYYYLGCFDKEEDAAWVYNIKALELQGEFAKLNIFPEGYVPPKNKILSNHRYNNDKCLSCGVIRIHKRIKINGKIFMRFYTLKNNTISGKSPKCISPLLLSSTLP